MWRCKLLLLCLLLDEMDSAACQHQQVGADVFCASGFDMTVVFSILESNVGNHKRQMLEK